MKHEAAHNRESLIKELTEGTTPEFLFFWGHRVPQDGSLTKSCFSQWYPAPFKVDDTL